MVTGYVLVSNPTIFSGHTVVAKFVPTTVHGQAKLFVDRYNEFDETTREYSPLFEVRDLPREIPWRVPDTGGYPIHSVGIEVESGTVLLDSLTWQGVPTTSWPAVQGAMWGRAWASSLSRFTPVRDGLNYMVQNSGRGFLTQGAREWGNYRFSVTLVPRMADQCGVVVRAQGLRRYYGFLFTENRTIQLQKELDGRKLLAEIPFAFEWHEKLEVEVIAKDATITLLIRGQVVMSYTDEDQPLMSGALGFVVENGCLGAEAPSVRPE